MYNLIRWIITFIILIIFIILVKKEKIVLTPLKRNIIMIFILGGLSTILCLIPLENALFSFESPEDAYQYMYLKSLKKDAIIINGESSTKIINKNETVYFPRKEDGWKLDPTSVPKIVYKEAIDKYSIHIIRYGNTDDYYVTVTSYNNKKFTLSDSKKSNFQSNDITGNADITIYSYVGCVNSIEDNYYILIDDEKILINI